ncbi:type I-E CRISPR-associated endoribonuclease Cas2 [Streptomyces sp. NPDC012510]|uniref:type I-E CRISPR-associated endoribonuclease Cas2 n=1 Tax=Streptomyces sp. NPDC012510 TaxID=3364838 RepID=UPI0036DFD60E
MPNPGLWPCARWRRSTRPGLPGRDGRRRPGWRPRRWTSEVVPGIFVGSVSARVRDQLWQAVTEGTAALEEPRHGGTAAGGTRVTRERRLLTPHSDIRQSGAHPFIPASYAGRRHQRPPGA